MAQKQLQLLKGRGKIKRRGKKKKEPFQLRAKAGWVALSLRL